MCWIQCHHLHFRHLWSAQWQHYGETKWTFVSHWLWKIPRRCSNVWQFQARSNTLCFDTRHGLCHQWRRKNESKISWLCGYLLQEFQHHSQKWKLAFELVHIGKFLIAKKNWQKSRNLGKDQILVATWCSFHGISQKAIRHVWQMHLFQIGNFLRVYYLTIVNHSR